MNSTLLEKLPAGLKPFFIPRRYLHGHEQITLPTHGKGRREWVFSRSFCYYRLFDMRNVDSARQESALQIKIQQWSPFPDYGCYIAWQDGYAQVWVWDSNEQHAAISEQGLKTVYPLPETVLHAPMLDGARLITCLDGVEGQVWRNGVLIGSRWWADLPPAKIWQRFLRSHSVAPEAEPPQSLSLPMLDSPWAKPRTQLGRLGEMALGEERLWVGAGALLLGVILVWQAMGLVKWRSAIAGLEAEVEALSNQTGDVLDARAQALQNYQQTDRLVKLNPYPSQLRVFAEVGELLPITGPHLVNWQYQSGELTFTVSTPRVNPTFYVERFQSNNLFQEVSTETGREPNHIVLRMKVLRNYELNL